MQTEVYESHLLRTHQYAEWLVIYVFSLVVVNTGT